MTMESSRNHHTVLPDNQPSGSLTQPPTDILFQAPSGLRLSVLPCLAALLVQGITAFTLLGGMELASDAAAYHQEAVALLNSPATGHAYYYPPGTTFFLALVYRLLGCCPLYGKLAMLLTAVATIPVVVYMGLITTRQARVARVAGFIMAVYPPLVLLGGQPYSQVLALFCFTAGSLGLLTIVKKGGMSAGLLAGFGFGYGCLVRPSMLSCACILPVLVYICLKRKQSLIPLLAGTCVFLAVILPVLCYNHQAGAGWCLSTNNEGNFFRGNNKYTPLYKTSHLAQRDVYEMPHQVRNYLLQFKEGTTRRERRMLEKKEALRHIASRPDLFLLRTLNRMRAFWGFDYLASRQIQLHLGGGPAVLAALLFLEASGYVFVMCLVAVGVICAHRQFSHRVALIIGLLVFFYQIPYMIAFASGTYHFPVMGVMMPFAGLGLTEWRKRIKTSFPRVFPVAVLVVIFLFAVLQIEYAYFTWQYM